VTFRKCHLPSFHNFAYAPLRKNIFTPHFLFSSPFRVCSPFSSGNIAA
jgi:hypothetical protein